MPLSALAGLSLLVIGESHMTLSNYLREPLHKALLAQGYALERVAAVMLHPATYHVMLLALLTRAEAAQ